MVYDRGMPIDPRLNEIDDCLYRVAVRALIVQNNKVLLVQETLENWWALPGGGVNHGETVQTTLAREIEEELGVPASDISSDLQIIHYSIGAVVNAVPRMNLFLKATVPPGALQPTNHVTTWDWFTREAFMAANLHSSYNKTELANVIFSN